MAVGQVGALVGEDRAQLRRFEYLQRAAGNHDRGGAARHAVGGGPGVVENDGAGCGRRGGAFRGGGAPPQVSASGEWWQVAADGGQRQVAADDAGRFCVRPGLPARPLDPVAVPPGRHRGARSEGDRQDRHAGLVEDTLVDRCGARVTGDGTAQSLREPWPVSRNRCEGGFECEGGGREDAGHRDQPRG